MTVIKPVTLNDIARRAGVSKVSVSKALRGHPDISAARREEIRQLAVEMGYTPNLIARNLSARRSFTIGVIVPKIAHYFFSRAIEAIYNAAFESGYEIVLMVSQENAERERKHLQTLQAMQVDGYLVSVSEQTTDYAQFDTLRRAGKPVVFFDRVPDDAQYSRVVVDDRQGAFNAVGQAIRNGYTEIAHLAGLPTLSISRLRRQGYEDALKKHDLPVQKEWIVVGPFTEQSGYDGFKKIIAGGKLPQMIFSASYPVAMGALKAMQDSGLSVPHDIDLISFGSSRMNRFVRPSLTYVDQPAEQVGQKAMEVLMEEIDHPETAGTHEEIIPTQLVINETCIQRTAK